LGIENYPSNPNIVSVGFEGYGLAAYFSLDCRSVNVTVIATFNLGLASCHRRESLSGMTSQHNEADYGSGE
jgi:hypothetical protein